MKPVLGEMIAAFSKPEFPFWYYGRKEHTSTILRFRLVNAVGHSAILKLSMAVCDWHRHWPGRASPWPCSAVVSDGNRLCGASALQRIPAL